MENKLSHFNANLNEYPSIQSGLKHIVIGDTHGNAQYLLYLLISFGIIELSPKDYQTLKKIYEKKTENITYEVLLKYRRILRKSKVSKDISILFLGDTLSDRGNNDYFNLCIFRLLSKREVPFNILLANHDYEFLQCYEKSLTDSKSKYAANNIKKSQTRSMTNLQRLMDKDMRNKHNKPLLNSDKVNEWVKLHLLNHYQAIGYSLSKKNITIYSHAPIDITIIKGIAEQLELAFEDKTVTELAKSIDRINTKIQALLNAHELCRMFSKMQNAKNMTDPLTRLIWNRDYKILKRKAKHRGYKVNYVHGHDKKDNQKQQHIISLDQKLGKTSSKTSDEFQFVQAKNFGFFNKASEKSKKHKTDKPGMLSIAI